MAEVLDTETDLPEAFLVALKARAERNSRLILASLAGVRAGAAQIEQIRAARTQLAHLHRRRSAGRGAQPSHPRPARLTAPTGAATRQPAGPSPPGMRGDRPLRRARTSPGPLPFARVSQAGIGLRGCA